MPATSGDARNTGRLRLTMVVLLCLGLALASFWLLQVMRKEINDSTPRAQSNDPDYFVDNFTFVRLAENGRARYVVNGEQLTHRPDDDSAEVARPLIQSFMPDRAPMSVRADTAHVAQDASRVDLVGNVHVERAASPGAPALKLATARLTVLPDEDLMRTDAPITVDRGTSSVSAVGMEANNATGQLHLQSRVRMVLRSAP